MTKIIRKAFQGTIPENKILDTYSESSTDTYSCNYVNNHSVQEEVVYNQKIYSATQTNIDLTKYKRLIISFAMYDKQDAVLPYNTGGSSNVAIMELTDNPHMGSHKTHVQLPYIVDGEIYAQYFVVEFSVNSEKTAFSFHCWYDKRLIENKKIIKCIEDYAQTNGYEIIDISETNPKYKIGPAEFVYLFEHSKYNFIDSFHGTVFSILFEKPFWTFERKSEVGYGNMNSRLSTILKLFGLENRYISYAEEIILFDKEIDYKCAIDVLEKQRTKSINFIKDSINITNIVD